MKRVHLAATSIVVWLALTGYAAARDIPADASRHRKPNAPTAWAFIQSRPELLYMSDLLSGTGFESKLQSPFSGTLLLPNNDALEAYVNLMEFSPTFTMESAAVLFWQSLVDYHMLPSAASTRRQKRTVAFNTNHFYEPSPNTYHQVTFLSRRAKGLSINDGNVTDDDGNVTASTFGQPDVYAVQDEQGNSVSFLSTDNEVLGGGFIHIISSVLQPDNVYPSVATLLDSVPELSNLSTAVKELNLTTLWPATCLWAQESVYVNGEYACLPQSRDDTCQPCTQSTCGVTLDYGYMRNLDYGCSSLCPPKDALRKATGTGGGGSRRRLTALRALLQGNGNRNNKNTAGTAAIEGYAGTFALPNNGAFDGFGGLPKIKFPLDGKRWRPVIQNHFVAAYHPPVLLASTELLRYDTQRKGGFGNDNKRISFLGQMRGNDLDYALTFTSTSTGCGRSGNEPCLAIEYPVRQGDSIVKDTTKIITRNLNDKKPGLNLQTPGHFYHIIDKVMWPLCADEDECNEPFAGKKNGDGKRKGISAN